MRRIKNDVMVDVDGVATLGLKSEGGGVKMAEE